MAHGEAPDVAGKRTQHAGVLCSMDHWPRRLQLPCAGRPFTGSEKTAQPLTVNPHPLRELSAGPRPSTTVRDPVKLDKAGGRAACPGALPFVLR